VLNSVKNDKHSSLIIYTFKYKAGVLVDASHSLAVQDEGAQMLLDYDLILIEKLLKHGVSI